MRLCPVCGVAASHNPQGGPCLACYRAGCAVMADARPYHAVVQRLLRTTTATDLADALGCTRQAVMDLYNARWAHVRRWLADAIDAHVERPQPCAVCDDIETALMSTSDPEVAARRVGRTVGALEIHARRCGRPALSRPLNRKVSS